MLATIVTAMMLSSTAQAQQKIGVTRSGETTLTATLRGVFWRLRGNWLGVAVLLLTTVLALLVTAVLILNAAQRRTRHLLWNPDAPIPSRLQPDDEVVEITRDFVDVFVSCTVLG